MKNTGMNRKLDVLGRIVIPAEIRRSLDLKEGAVLEISMEQDQIILAPRRDSCVFCGGQSELTAFGGRKVCPSCVSGLAGKASA